jgi:phage protein D
MSSTAATPGLYAALPQLYVDGKKQDALSQNLTELLVEETTEGMMRCEATMVNWGPVGGGVGFLYFDRKLLDFGKAFKVDAGAGGAAGTIFDGRVMSIEGRYGRERPPEILTFAEDRLQDLRMTRRTRTFENVTDSDLFQQLASEHGMQSQLVVTGPQYKVMAQVNQSDLAFLRERARAVDAELWIEGTTLHVQARSHRDVQDVSLSFGQKLYEFSVTADLAMQVSSLTVSGWDVSGKQALSHQADDSTLGAELNGDLGGSKVLGQAIGTRDQQIVHRLPANSDETQALAEAEYRRGARRFLTGTGVAEGNANVRVGTKLTLSNLGTLFDGKYYVTHTRHTYDLINGYRTWFAVERPGLGQ